MAITAGMTSAIMNPIRHQEMEAINAANLLMNQDSNGGRWIQFSKTGEEMKQGKTFVEASQMTIESGGGGRKGRRSRARRIV